MRIIIEYLRNCPILKPCFKDNQDTKEIAILLTALGVKVAKEMGDLSWTAVQIGTSSSRHDASIHVESENVFSEMGKIIFVNGRQKTTFLRRADDITEVLMAISHLEEEIDYDLYHLGNGLYGITVSDDNAVLLKLTI